MARKPKDCAAKLKELTDELTADIPRSLPPIEIEQPIGLTLVLPGGKKIPWKEPPT